MAPKKAMLTCRTGPHPVAGWLTHADRDWIFNLTSCAVHVKRNALTVEGPIARVAEANQLAQAACRRNQDAGQKQKGGSWVWQPVQQPSSAAASSAGSQGGAPAGSGGMAAASQHGLPAAACQHGLPAAPQHGLPAAPQHGLPAASSSGSLQGLPAGSPKDVKDSAVWQALLDCYLGKLLQTEPGDSPISATNFVWEEYRYDPLVGGNGEVPDQPPPFIFPPGAAKSFGRIDFYRGQASDDRGNWQHAIMFDLGAIQRWGPSHTYQWSKAGPKGNLVEGIIGSCYHLATDNQRMPDGKGKIAIRPDDMKEKAVKVWCILMHLGFGPPTTVPNTIEAEILGAFRSFKAAQEAAASRERAG